MNREYRFNSDTEFIQHYGSLIPTNVLYGLDLGELRNQLTSSSSILGAIDKMALDKSVQNFFVEGQRDNYELVVPRRAAFPESEYPCRFAFRQGDSVDAVNIVNKQDLVELRKAVSGDWLDEEDSSQSNEIARFLLGKKILVRSQENQRNHFKNEGVYRLQHASLLFKSSDCVLLTDPVYGVRDSWLHPQDLPQVDVILISHSHNDHFSLLSLMQFPTDTTIVLPKSNTTMLSVNMASLLRDAGFTNVIEAECYKSIELKDMKITSMPFFGEQPWLDFESPFENFRNNANTFIVDSNGFKTWILIDSGQEYGHSMVDIAHLGNEYASGIDLVMSNLGIFGWRPGAIDGSGRYLFCFPQDILEDPNRWPDGKKMTFGPDGMQHFLDIVQPKHFLPYAHWWREPGSVAKTGESYYETHITNKIMPNGSTRILNWNVGDSVHLKNGVFGVGEYRK